MAERKPDRLNATDLAAEYDFAYALIMSDPELKRLFRQALRDPKGQWTPQKFMAKLRTTKWYQEHSESWRTTEALRLTDPAEYKRQIDASEASVEAYAASMGATLTDDQVKNLAWTFYRQGYGEQQIKAAMAAYIKPPDMAGGLAGVAGEVEDELRALAERNGMTYGDSFYLNAARQVAGGTVDIATFTDQIRNEAATQYPIYRDKIVAGMDVADLASGYVQRMAATYEVDPTQISLQDPKIKAALGGIDGEGNPTAMGLWDFEKSLRSDARWGSTKQARDSFDSAAAGILRAFGFM